MEKLFLTCAGHIRSLGIPLSDAFALRFQHIVRVGFVGVAGLLVQTTIFEVLGIRLGILSASTAALVGGEIAVLLGFTLNNHFNFRGRNTDPLWQRLLIFHLVVSGSLFVQWFLVRLVELNWAGDPWLLRGAFVVGVCIGFMLNYIGYHLFVWKRT